MSASDPVAIALEVAAVLERLSIRYVLGGSLASVVFGEPRATLDVDLAVDLDESRVDTFLDAVEPAFFVDRAWAAEEVRLRGSFQLVHRASMIRVDMFVPEWTGLHLWKWQQRRRVSIGPDRAELDVTSPEAIVIQKLVWYRGGGEVSDRQWRDVLGVLKNQGAALDRSAMTEQARSSGISDLLAKASREAGLDD